MEGRMPVVLLHKYYLFVLIFTITKTHDDDDDDDDHDKICAIRISSDKICFYNAAHGYVTACALHNKHTFINDF